MLMQPELVEIFSAVEPVCITYLLNLKTLSSSFKCFGKILL